ncbi:16S rRNA (guanine(527)-N(7))-methyltransferase RsmG [Psychrosphaera sp. F3M07]|uniref:Ribosomal RNA small subunit methyltransferase G n=1 Tax=Psychrosphaera aquimarina TaxID=2044854 RepID=A0ABU3QYD7_9GAMM|nr:MULTISPECIES: 16S rRNA (guanine(527)-N(7))-methyltransferase RsmG [Psychrosphaera]MBU2918406.1 16S rRNA (guanine(527)-N(7))-methyltransferase RsmG [Psychrosphaera sp. F3M07]MDU0112227.1 16S rRNA (guanine(527)-N(7))-methyltransferase RsmG [Psychrosphaera aquimarina]
MLKAKLAKLIAKTDLQVNEQQLDQLVAYVGLLNKWNKAYNLTSVRQPEQMLVKHIVDSLVVSPHLSEVSDINNKFIDVGTGPGLPGIPLAIVNPELEFTLLDSLGKRIRFITQVKHELKLDNVTPLQSRVEDHQGQYAGVLSRAFASISDMVNWSHHLVAKDGLFYALKGQLDQQEIDQLPDFVTVKQVHTLLVPELDGERHLVLLKNVS